MSSIPAIKHRGLRHVALNVVDVANSIDFYTKIFGMHVVWKPDSNNAYLSSGCDNLALHQTITSKNDLPDRLDHLGFIVATAHEVDKAASALRRKKVRILKPARTHRDGSRSLYCADPDGTVIQVLYEPTLSKQQIT